MKDAIQWEKDRANNVVDQVCAQLNTSLCRLLNIAWEGALPLLEKGRHRNPIHHTAHVVNLAVQIGQDESFSDGELAQLLVATVFHDAGNAFEPKDEPKITVGDVRSDPAKKDDAIEQRRRHMVAGGKLVEVFLTDLEPAAWEFTSDGAKQIVRLVEIHDNPTVAELQTGKEREKSLLHNAGWLSQILREADRLWMLTEDGLITDMVRKEKRGKPWQPLAQITHNAIRHHEERYLYEAILGPDASKLGFDYATAFYRTDQGKALFRDLQFAARAVADDNWNRCVREAVARELPVC